MAESKAGSYILAIQDFRRARWRATVEQVVAALTGQSTKLLSYEEVRRQLRATEGSERGLQSIRLDAIVGSVGRYTDFTRSFLPREDRQEQRWARVSAAVSGLVGLPPIEVYQIGEAFFVKDGNHRVSVAGQLGATHIEAYVTQITSKVPLTPDIQPDELILKAEYATFLEQTGLDQLRPEADLTLTAPGGYDTLLEHIEVHRYFMGLEQQREIPYAEAVGHWYDTVYRPAMEIIRQRGVLRDFAGRSEADLYIWLHRHRAELQETLTWQIDLSEAADHLADEVGPGHRRPEGEQREREAALEPHAFPTLFSDLLVPLSGEEACWPALEQAIEIGRREGGRLRGLHVVAEEDELDNEQAGEVQAEFDRRCQAAGVDGRLAIQAGKVADWICEGTRWADLAVLCLQHPPGPKPLDRLGSGFRGIVRRCPRPILAVPAAASPLRKALLAYDGSPKADEALFVAAYMAGRWGTELVVLSVEEKGRAADEPLARAQGYLAGRGVQARPVEASGPVGETILAQAKAQAADILVMGGYGRSRLVELVLGSAVDEVLRLGTLPVLLCR